jgi:hypothetical protein
MTSHCAQLQISDTEPAAKLSATLAENACGPMSNTDGRVHNLIVMIYFAMKNQEKLNGALEDPLTPIIAST